MVTNLCMHATFANEPGFARMGGRPRGLAFAAITAISMFFASTNGARAADCEGVEPVSGERIEFALVHPLLNRPVGVTAPASDPDHLYIVEQRGLVRVLRLATGQIESTPYLTLSSRVSQEGRERGLLGVAFHPRYEETGHVYVHYTLATTGASVISRFTVAAASPLRVDATSEVVLLRVEHPSAENNGGSLAFGPDGNLHVGLGDGGPDSDVLNRSQNPQTPLGKILRLDVDAGGEAPYGIPADNPFVADASVLGEIWALGLRNPWSMTFDSLTGDLFIADVGEANREEIDFEAAGSGGGYNYEWRRREGTRMVNADTPLLVGEPRAPIYEYAHSTTSPVNGCAVIGGVVYRGCRMPDLHGAYFFADHCGNWIRSARVENGAFVDLRDRTRELNSSIPLNRVREITAFGTDARGEIYVCDLSGKLFRIVPRTRNLAPIATIATVPSPPELLLVDGSAEIVLDSSASDDGDGGIQELTAAWSKVSGPAGDEIVTPDARSTIVRFSRTGRYVFRLTIDDGTDSATADVSVLVVDDSATDFRRGDSNDDGGVDLSDGVTTLQFLFLGGRIDCHDAADANDSGELDLTDAVYTFNYLFLGGVEPPSPGTSQCGPDPSADLLPDCAPRESCL